MISFFNSQLDYLGDAIAGNLGLIIFGAGFGSLILLALTLINSDQKEK